LVVTFIALIKLSCLQKTIFIIPTLGAIKTRWPAPVDQRFSTLFFCSIMLKQIN